MSQLSAELGSTVGRYQRALLTKFFVLTALTVACLFALGLRFESILARGVLAVVAVLAVLGIAYGVRLRWLSRRAAMQKIDDTLDLKQRLLTVSEFEKLSDPPPLYNQLLEDTREKMGRMQQHLPRPVDRKALVLAVLLLLLLFFPWKGTAPIQLAQLFMPPSSSPIPPPDPQQDQQQPTHPDQPQDRQESSSQQEEENQEQPSKGSQPKPQPSEGSGESESSPQRQKSGDSKDGEDSSEGSQGEQQSSQGSDTEPGDGQQGSEQQSSNQQDQQGRAQQSGSQQEQGGGDSKEGASSSEANNTDGSQSNERKDSAHQQQLSGEGQQEQSAASQSSDQPGQGEKSGGAGAHREAQAVSESSEGNSGQGASVGGQEALRGDIQKLLKEMQGELQEIQAQLEQQADKEGPSAGQGTDPNLYGDAQMPPSILGNESKVPLQLETDTERIESKRKAGGVGSASYEGVSTEGPSAKREEAFLAEQPLEETAGARRAVPPEYQSVFESLYQRTGETNEDKP